MKNKAIILIFLVNSIFTVSCTFAQSNSYKTVINLFDNAQIVFLGESHWSRQDSDFRIELLKTHNLVSKIDDVVIEFGNSLYQDLLDAYFLDLKDISDTELSKVWRNTTSSSGVWDSPVYKEFLMEVRKINNKLPKKDRIRIVAMGPPIDWDKVEVFADQLPFFNRGWSFVRVIEREVIAKNHKALVIIGSGHLNRFDNDMDEDDNLIRRLEALHPQKHFKVVVPVRLLTAEALTILSSMVKRTNLPIYINTHMSPFNNLKAGNYLPETIGVLGEVVDGLIFWGSIKDEEVSPDKQFYEINSSYYEELKRRQGLKMRLPLKSYN